MEGYSDGGSVRHVLDFMIFNCSKGEERIDRVELLCNDVTDVSSRSVLRRFTIRPFI